MEIPPLNKKEREKDLRWLFDLGLLLKAVNGILEVFVAFLVFLVPPAFILRIVEFVTGGELAQDPDDPIIAGIRDAAQSFAVHSHYLLALYLALHGAIKVILVIGIYMKKRLAYPLFMVALALFGSYEAYRGFMRQEFLLQVLAIFDFSLLILTAYEYRRRYPLRQSFSEASPILLALRDTQEDYADR